MRKILFFVFVLSLIPVLAFGAMTNTRITGNTVSFSTVTGGWKITPNVVTFNTTTTRIKLINLSTIADCYVDLKCTDSDGCRGYLTRDSATVLVPALGRTSPNTIEIDFATKNLGFAADGNQTSGDGTVKNSNQQIHYIALSDTGTF